MKYGFGYVVIRITAVLPEDGRFYGDVNVWVPIRKGFYKPPSGLS